MKRNPLIALIVVLMSLLALGQTAPPSNGGQPAARRLLERLGYPRDAKLLIVHADDLGMAHSINAATIKALETGTVNSGSIMVPCPWFPEIAAYARSHSGADFGLHLTLTSEWSTYRWGPVLSKDRVPSLLDRDGYLYPLETEAAKHADVREAEAEIRAQIERARASGIRPTHLDSHMRTLYQNEALFRMFLRVARDNKLPVMISREWFAEAPFFSSALGPDDIVLDRIIDINPDVTPERWGAFYTDAIKGLQPGVTQIIVHLASDDKEMQAITVNHPDWGAGWRQRDFDVFTSASFGRLLQEHNVRLITWREIGRLLEKRQM